MHQQQQQQSFAHETAPKRTMPPPQTAASVDGFPRQSHGITTSKPLSRPMYDAYGGQQAATADMHDSLYTSPYGRVASTQPYSVPPATQQQNMIQRTSSLQPSTATVPSHSDYSALQPPPSSTSMYYYATPSTTPTTAHADNNMYGYSNGARPARQQHQQPYGTSPAPPPPQQMSTPASDYHQGYVAVSHPPTSAALGDHRSNPLRTSSNPAYHPHHHQHQVCDPKYIVAHTHSCLTISNRFSRPRPNCTRALLSKISSAAYLLHRQALYLRTL